MQKTITMKTKRLYTAVILMMTILFAFALQANTINPPTTNSMTEMPAFEEEAYIADIPFSTAAVKANLQFEAAIELVFQVEEEEYVNDIPFNTEAVAEATLFDEAMNQEFDMEDEAYIEDIPFDTQALIKEHKCNSHYALNK